MVSCKVNGQAYEIEGILFDKDGTLLDFGSLWVQWGSNLIAGIQERVSGERSADKKMLERFIGFTPDQESWDPKGPLAIGSLDQLLTVLSLGLYQQGIPWNEAYTIVLDAHSQLDKQSLWNESLKPIAGLKDLLEQCRKASIPMGVVTSDDHEQAIQHLKHLGIDHYFGVVVGHDQVQRGKPYPDMAEYACRQLSVQLEKTLMFGDSNGDMELAGNCNMRAGIGISPKPAEKSGHLEDANQVIENYFEVQIEQKN